MEKKNKHYFYVLECRDGSYYGGYTVDPARRLSEHNSKKASKYTRTRTPVSMIYVEEFEEKGDALKAEYAFKQLTRLKKEQFLHEAGERNAKPEKQ
ncbi:GIY-YIG nuclease family protein [Siminovitchia fortis]|uniref:GIY-YIG nuclease family protein n=1 Tax=Siminovitchia fortis TaxID=254758 RepID=A0A443INA1_9BACI|nr:GIY-YIG nuclease family protein [Siminovitchia fortis]RWR07174.1 GIY-YIG nuclease family protein [Siminovitchia fortis]WHY81346.1 GIY-YIG nuclease family protein [Siminovitchia fortis]